MRLGVGGALVDGVIVPGDVEVADGIVAAVGLPSPDGRGIAVPGFIDLQVNGFAGVDFAAADGDGYREAGEALLATGVTAFQPTFITAPEEELRASLAAVPASATADGPRVLGVHLEGPFLAPSRLGMHPAVGRRNPDPEFLVRLLDAGPVRQVTLAPELPGALELIDLLVARGVTVSCGHTDATAEEGNRAFDRGARTVTHIFNAMRVGTPRAPGIALAALVREDVDVQIILDGHHLSHETAMLAWRAAGGRLALVSDAVAAAGMGDGQFWLGSVRLFANDGVVRREDGTLAGTVLTMIEAVRALHALGATFEQAVDAATRVPARIARLTELGRLSVGLAADVIVLDDRLEIQRVLVGGKTRVAG
jgi:N-acetylglucosamine-6-phosphate deacetylase